jgi:hypothetical protein
VDCIDSIYSETKNCSFEIIVVDNDSGDDSKNIILHKFPNIIWIQMEYNAGFARANNAGIKIASGEHILLLNADTIILDNAIEKSISLLNQQPEAVGCGVQLLNTDGTTQISGAHFMKGGLNLLLPLPYLGKLVRYLGYKFKSTIPSVQHVPDKIEVDWVVGAYILVKKETLAKSGLLDEDFFMYAEEIEWCSRLRKQGKLFLFAEPRVIHFGGGTSSDYYETSENENGKNLWNKKGRQIIVSNLLRIRKQFGIFWFLIIFGAYLVDTPIFLFCLAIEKLFKANKAKYKWKDFSGYCTNMVVLSKYFIKIIMNKPYFYKVA